jgi:hypothetical protein
MSTAVKLNNVDASSQGAGMINAEAAVKSK